MTYANSDEQWFISSDCGCDVTCSSSDESSLVNCVEESACALDDLLGLNTTMSEWEITVLQCSFEHQN